LCLIFFVFPCSVFRFLFYLHCFCFVFIFFVLSLQMARVLVNLHINKYMLNCIELYPWPIMLTFFITTCSDITVKTSNAAAESVEKRNFCCRVLCCLCAFSCHLHSFILCCFYNRPFCCWIATRVKKNIWTYLNWNYLFSLGSKYWQNSDVWRDSVLVCKSWKTELFQPTLFYIVLGPSVSKDPYLIFIDPYFIFIRSLSRIY
jgi:hypothetical protein